MKFKVLVAGRYNNAQHKAANFEQGEILETAPEYGAILVADGYVEALEDEKKPKAKSRPLPKPPVEEPPAPVEEPEDDNAPVDEPPADEDAPEDDGKKPAEKAPKVPAPATHKNNPFKPKA